MVHSYKIYLTSISASYRPQLPSIRSAQCLYKPTLHLHTRMHNYTQRPHTCKLQTPQACTSHPLTTISVPRGFRKESTHSAPKQTTVISNIVWGQVSLSCICSIADMCCSVICVGIHSVMSEERHLS